MIPFATLLRQFTRAEALDTILSVCATLGLPVTAWQPGSVVRTGLTAVAQLASNLSGLVSIPIRGGFLDYAAATDVTPEYGPGWLDVCGSSVYGAKRLPATSAACRITLANASAAPISITPGSFRCAQGGGSKATYSSFESATLTAANTKSIAGSANAVLHVVAHGMSDGDIVLVKNHLVNTAANGSFPITVGDADHITLVGYVGSGTGGASGTVTDPVNTTFAILADSPGSASSAGPGAINAINTPFAGVSIVTNTLALGTDPETNANYAARCRTKQAARSPNGPHDAYSFFARTINGPDEPVHVTSGPLDAPAAPVTKSATDTDPTTGSVTTYVASAVGAYATPPNYTNQVAKGITSSTNASPIVIHKAAHGYVTGDQIDISEHEINTAANGPWTIVRVDADHYSLNGSTGNGVGAATGTSYRYSDLDLIDQSIQANAVPDGVTAATLTATALVVDVAGDLYVPATSAAGVEAVVSAALADYLATFPLGGITTSAANRLPYENLVRVINAALPVGAASVGIEVNGDVVDLAMSVHEDAQLGTVALTVHSV